MRRGRRSPGPACQRTGALTRAPCLDHRRADAPPHVTLNQIFLGMLPFMGIQILAIVLLYVFPQIGLWLPQILYK